METSQLVRGSGWPKDHFLVPFTTMYIPPTPRFKSRNVSICAHTQDGLCIVPINRHWAAPLSTILYDCQGGRHLVELITKEVSLLGEVFVRNFECFRDEEIYKSVKFLLLCTFDVAVRTLAPANVDKSLCLYLCS